MINNDLKSNVYSRCCFCFVDSINVHNYTLTMRCILIWHIYSNGQCNQVHWDAITHKNVHKFDKNSDHVVENRIVRAYSLKWIALAFMFANHNESPIYSSRFCDSFKTMSCSSLRSRSAAVFVVKWKLHANRRNIVNKTIEIFALKQSKCQSCVVWMFLPS